MYTAPGHHRKNVTMPPNKPIVKTLKKVLLVPTWVFLAAVAIMALGIFFGVAPATLLGLEDTKPFIRGFYAVVGTVACVTLPFAVTSLIIKVSETDTPKS